MEEWIVRHLNHLPSASEFNAYGNFPVVLEGAVKTWRAYTCWNTATGGLQHLKDLAGTAAVQAMASTSSTFFGDIRSHSRREMAFSQILDIAGAAPLSTYTSTKLSEEVCSAPIVPAGMGGQDPLRSDDLHLYLAQVPMYNSGKTVNAPLHRLMEDICLPEFLGPDTSVTNVNFWMSVNGSRSSIHYDPFHNLLCVVVGSKEVTLWPPSAAALLYPLPIFGEASNHSSVNFVEPDYEVNPLFKEAMQHSQTVNLTAGDVLFIPEGWYHQVNSERVTIAVNVWWPSKISLALGTHMDGYYLRRVVASLVDSEKDLMLASWCQGDGLHRQQRRERVADECRSLAVHPGVQTSSTMDDLVLSSSRQHDEKAVEGRTGSADPIGLRHLSPLEAQYLSTLVLSVSSRFEDVAVAVPPCSLEIEDPNAAAVPNSSCIASCEMNAKHLDRVAEVFYSLEPLVLQRILRIMIEEFPHSLEALILYGLSPAAAEALTRKFDQMESVMTEQTRAQFFESFYKIFDDPDAAMTAVLNGKEAFAAEALRNVLAGMLGIHC